MTGLSNMYILYSIITGAMPYIFNTDV